MLNFISALIIVAVENLMSLATIIVVIFLGYMVTTSGPFRALIKGTTDLITFKLAQIPFFAEAIYTRRIGKLEDQQQLITAYQEEALGELELKKQELSDGRVSYLRLIKRVEEAKKLGDISLAEQLAIEVIYEQDYLTKLKEVIIPSAQASADAATQRVLEIKTLIENVKKDKRDSLSMARISRIEKTISEALMGEGLDHESRMINSFKEKATQEKKMAIGARLALENSPEKRIERLDKQISMRKAQEFLDNLDKPKLDGPKN